MVRKECIRISESHAPIREFAVFASEGEKKNRKEPLLKEQDARERVGSSKSEVSLCLGTVAYISYT